MNEAHSVRQSQALVENMRSGGFAIGSWISTVSPVVAELMAGAGFDFLTIDAEHSMADYLQVQQILQGIAAANPDCAGLVRTPGRCAAMSRKSWQMTPCGKQYASISPASAS